MENHDRQQVAEFYTISQVTDLTGVPENTIRSWERRFGLPEPDRTAGGQRRYTPSDVDLIRAIQASRDAGRTMDQAIADARSRRRTNPTPPLTVVPSATQPPSSDAIGVQDPAKEFTRRLSNALSRLDFPGAERVLSDSLLALPVETVAMRVLLLSSEALRRSTIQGEMDQPTLALAHQWIERKVAAAYEASNPEAGDHHALVLGLDGNVPSMAFAYGIALSRGGFRTTTTDIGPAAVTVRDLVDALRPDCLVLHASTPDGILARDGAIRMVDEWRGDGDWRGLVAYTSEASNVTTIPPVHAIGEDTVTVATRLRQALEGHSKTTKDGT